MKKLISCLLVVMLMLTVVGAFAEPMGVGRFGEYGALRRFLKETDLQTKDIALQVESEGKVSDLVIRVDGDNIHLVSRNDAVEDSHVQLNPTGIYVGAEGNVTLLRYATIITGMQNIINELNAVLDEAVKSIPEDAMPTEAEMKKAVNELAILASAVKQQEQADAATLSAAAMAFANKFKPEYILDVVEDGGSVIIKLRSEAFATAFAEAIDELMLNPDLAELVDRQAALTGTREFTKYQKEWAKYRKATLEAIRTMESTEVIDENGHWVSHFQIGEEVSAIKILMCDTDAWIDAENGNAQIAVALGFKDEAPLMVYELAVDQYSYHEKLSSGDSYTDVQAYFEDNRISGAKIVTVIEGTEWMRMEAGSDYFYAKGPKGGISTSVRETWTGKTRYELVAETADGKEATITVDFYEDGDSLVCELHTSESEQPAIFRISRIDKVDIVDLSASEKINEITVDQINAELKSILTLVTNIEAPASAGTPEEAAAMTENGTADEE